MNYKYLKYLAEEGEHTKTFVVYIPDNFDIDRIITAPMEFRNPKKIKDLIEELQNYKVIREPHDDENDITDLLNCLTNFGLILTTHIMED